MNENDGMEDLQEMLPLARPGWVAEYLDPDLEDESLRRDPNELDATDEFIEDMGNVVQEHVERENGLWPIEVISILESMATFSKGAVHEAGKRGGVSTPFAPLAVEIVKAKSKVEVLSGENAQRIAEEMGLEDSDETESKETDDSDSSDRMFQ